MRAKQIFTLQDVNQFKQKVLVWSQQFTDVVWLDSNKHTKNHGVYDAVLATDAFTSITTDYYDAFNKLKEYQTQTNDWIFGYLAYDLKNDIEDLSSGNFDGLSFPDLYFFQPKKLFFFKGNTVELSYLNMLEDQMEADFKIIDTVTVPNQKTTENPIKISLRIHKDTYFEKVNTVLEHIFRGDIYEANFCQEFYAKNVQIEPLHIYNKLNRISNTPFAVFLKYDDKYLLSASPERYLKKEESSVMSQPIKGTAKRLDNKTEDQKLKQALAQNEKERSENIMIVDLVRNDLSKTAKKGSVKVEELCRVYTFNQVHQMMSTVVSKVLPQTHPVDIIKSTFPMGSMTGAPKISAMQIIERLEETKRGLYSGAVGYFTPNGNFDFNVVIRSILYNETLKYVSYSVGGAITAKSNPQNEYEECLVKAKAMREVLET
ncbi:MAG: aminodeoxychorismate synthase component I [Aestuariibaculum sp.]